MDFQKASLNLRLAAQSILTPAFLLGVILQRICGAMSGDFPVKIQLGTTLVLAATGPYYQTFLNVLKCRLHLIPALETEF
ncbi:hypothetical protein BHYA_0220g00120 [Botrytis hyacinthi]|uniref:Uncharacterized protein n=1 Tax=Botrytis hyacinthi TaxID=278943 RepID=A0A4Z1GJH6_9HELO|nr:hypothetical protein BHYA_0220g00120 [Botrytis hyacinthi]